MKRHYIKTYDLVSVILEIMCESVAAENKWNKGK